MTPSTRHPHALLRRAVPTVLALVLLTACGGGSDEPAAPDEQQAADPGGATDGTQDDDGAAGTGSTQGDTEDGATQDDQGLCADLPLAEVQAAVGDVVTLTGSSPVPGRDQCDYAIADAEGSGLSVYATTPGLYEQRVAQADMLDEEAVQRPDLGAEAILLNNADLTVVLADGRELVVALQAFYTDGRALDQAAIAEGVLAVGELAVDRIG